MSGAAASRPRSGAPLAALRRITATRPTPVPQGERCEMCAEPIADQHQHVVNLESRALICACRACYLLFTAPDAQLRYRAVPDRYLSFPEFRLDGRQYDELEIPVGLAFLFENSVLGRTVAFYPGPAGATESELPLEAWDRIVAANPQLNVLRPDVEALLIRGATRGRNAFSCHLVPIDACYELVGQLRLLWRGFDGGTEVHDAMDEFFEHVAARSRPARSEHGPSAP
jgi:Family of unknown function (DUF5947)